MSSNITFNGVTYSIPAEGDNGWGPDLTAYFISIASNALQKTGGTFTLTAEAAFGATYGLKAPYFKSYAANPAAAGAVRLGNTESISWRNNANGADLALSSNASDALIFNSKNILFSALGLIVNADINAAAAIAFSKMAALTVSRLLVSDGSGVVSVSAVTATEAGYLAGVTSAIQTQMNLKAPLASPTFSGTITTPLTASRLLVSGASSELAVSAVTAAEAAYLSGVTSAIQTQLDAKQLRSTLTTKGDLYVATASNVVARQGVGANDTVLAADSSQTNGMAYHSTIDPELLQNVGLACSVGSNALTIALKTAAAADASATDPIKVAFRNATIATGDVSLVKVTAALSTVISSGSTAGHVSTIESPIYVGLLNNAGALELCWSTTPWNENGIISTTAEGGAGAADSATVIYSTTARSNVASRIIGKLLSTQTTAGTWAAVPTNISIGSASKVRGFIPPTVQTLTVGSGTYTLPTVPRKPVYIVVKMVGGGGGGAGSGTTPGAATDGADSTFGSSLLTSAKGVKGSGTVGGAGGVCTINAPAIQRISSTGGAGNGVSNVASAAGGQGGNNMFGGAGGAAAGGAANAGGAAATNTGCGGGGGSVGGASTLPGGGGGAAGYLEAIIANPALTYAYTAGAKGTGGTLGTNGAAGGNGSDGIIWVEEHYQ